jgi:hypothetical protein
LTADASKQGAKLEGRDDFRKYFDSAIDVPGRATQELSRAAKESGVFGAPDLGLRRRIDAAGLRHPARKARRRDLLGELHAAPADGNIREAIISPLGQVLAGPLFNEDAILLAEVDLAEIARGKYDFDVVGHYARPDVFRLHVNETATPPVIVD